jgi:thioredoxin 1
MDKKTFLDKLENKSSPLIIKFSAVWCGPCKKIQPIVDNYHPICEQKNIEFIEIDIDDSIDLFAFMKRKRILTGVPSIIYYTEDNNDVYPDDSVVGGDTQKVTEFFDRIL